MPIAEAPQGKYLYCIIRSEEPVRFGTLGIGEKGDVVHTVEYMGLAAVVSDSPVVTYEGSRREMMVHTLVLEEVMGSHAILPVRFGTVAPSADAVREKLLKRRFGELNGLFTEVEHRVELGLKAFWYEEVVFKEIVAENPPIRTLRDSLVGRRQEETYYDRIRLGELIESAMWNKRTEDSEAILSRLRPLAITTVSNKVITDRMVLNAAFLVEDASQPRFDETVKALDAEMTKRLVFKYVGPVPPYNFVNIVVSWED
jgi:hypothetical protein